MKKPTLQTFMWDNYFKEKYDALPLGRHIDTVNKLKKLIVDMYNAGYSAAGIGRFMGKDHTTILHHLGFTARSQEMESTPNKSKKVTKRGHYGTHQSTLIRLQEKKDRALANAERLRQKREEEEKIRLIRLQEKKDSAAFKQRIKQEREDRLKAIDALREDVFKQYATGASFSSIAVKFGLAYSRVQALLTYHPRYREVMKVRSYNRGRPVIQYTKAGEKIREFKTATEAGKVLGVARNGITVVCRGRTPSIKGFVFKYADEVKAK